MPNDNQNLNTSFQPDPLNQGLPTMPGDTNIPPASPNNPLQDTPKDSSILNPTLPQGANGSSQNPPPSGDQPNSTVTSTHVPQKYGGKKIIATIFGVLLLVGAVAAGVTLVQRVQELRRKAAEGPGNIAVFKFICDNIGDQDVCNGRDISLGNYKVDFKVHEGENDQGSVVQTITVTISDNQNGQGNTGNASQGRSVGDSLTTGKYTVCEIPIAYNSTGDRVPLQVEPRPEASQGGSSGGTNQKEFGENCITVDLNPGEAELKFLDKRQSPAPPTSTPTTATTVTPKPTVPGAPPVSCPVGTQYLFATAGQQLTTGTSVALGGTITSQQSPCSVITKSGVLLAQYCKKTTIDFSNPVNLDTVLIFDNDPKAGELPWSINGISLTTTPGSGWATQKLDKTVTQMVFDHGGDSSNYNVCVKTSSFTPTVTLSPEITARCNDVKTYDLDGIELSQSQLSDLKPGDKVRFAVSGQTSSGSFTKARFTVNGTSLGETTTTNSGGEFYTEYTIPQNVTTFTVKGEVFHSSLDWI